MIDPLRIDQAITPAGLIRSAAAYSLFVAHDGVYAIKTGPGWRLQFRGGSYRPERMVEGVRRVEAVLDPSDLRGEVATRDGSFFVSAPDVAQVVLGRRFDQLPDLRFADGERTYRFQFDEGRSDEVAAFAQALSALPPSVRPAAANTSNERPVLWFEGNAIRTVALPSPCWGATPHIALIDGRTFVQYLAPTGVHHAEAVVVYQATYDEHCDIVFGRTGELQLCQRLIHEAWGSTPPPVGDPWRTEATAADRTSSIAQLEKALALCITRRELLEQNQGGGSAEQQDRQERIHRHEVEQATFERALLLLGAAPKSRRSSAE